ncbi:MAG: D-alanine--D-alanine ligase [Bacteroidales bacterium]|nr:D-alanine--D-alanine ligase [Bacteroidales bacterium]
MIQRLKIALLMGGDSGEYEVSIGSATVVNKYLDAEEFDVYPILMKARNWTYTSPEGTAYSVDKDDFTLTLEQEKVYFDCAFIAIHGTPGEDGKLQGYLDIIGIPYTSCDLTTSAITFNKYFCNDLALQYGMNVAKTIIVRSEFNLDLNGIITEVGLPCFVKPNKSGSSVGVTKVYQSIELLDAVKKAFSEDDEVLIQQFIKGREMACGVYRTNGEVVVLPVTEVISKKDFFDYEAKYTKGMAEEITPANISTSELEDCQSITRELYNKFNCSGVVRFDYFLTEGKWWFLEVNTVPGFSEGSIIPKQVLASGNKLNLFFRQLIIEAISQKSKV